MFAQFSSQTSIRSFTYAKNAKSLREKCMWYCIIVVTACLTCWDVHDTFKYFFSLPISTRTLVSENVTISFERPTVCVPFENDFRKVGDMNEQSISQLLSDIWPKVYFQNHSIETNKPLEKFLSLSLAVLSSNSRAQYFGAALNKLSYNYTWGFLNFNAMMEGHNQAKAAANWFQSQNIKMKTLIQIVGVLLCQEYQISLRRMSSPTSNFSCATSDFSWVGMQPMYPLFNFACLYVPSELFTFQSAADVTVFTAQIPQSNNFSVMSLDLSGQIMMSYRCRAALWISSGASLSVQIQISSAYKHRNTANQRCVSRKETIPICMFACMQDYIAKMCNCMPFGYFSAERLENLPDCTVEISKFSKSPNSSECLLVQKEFSLAKLCGDKCPRECEYTVLSFAYIPFISSSSTINKTVANLFVDPYVYPIIEEFFLISPKQFLGSLGGNLSLYLGASFVAIYHALYFWTSSFVAELRFHTKGK